MPNTEQRDDAAILTEARERREYHDSVDSENRKNAREDTKFVWVKGAQWPDGVRTAREQDERPWLEINQLPQFINQVVNDQRQGRPGIRINPASGDASEEVAEILQGMIRHIEYESNAEAAYDSAFAHAVTGGRGYWRICSEYEYGQSFNQCLKIKRVPDPDSVRIDCDYQDPDAGDIRWAMVDEAIQKDEFRKRWPKADAVSFEPTGNANIWYDGDKVIIADYYRKVETKRTLVAMSDGTVGWKDELPESLPAGIEIVREREAEDCKVEWYKVAGGEQILESYDWPGKNIPVVMCIGDEIMVEGKRIFQGLIRRARDPQTMYNYWITSGTEQIALAPKVPYVAAEGQLEGYENEWQNANKKSYSVLTYKPTSIGGIALPPPQRVQFAGVPTGIIEQANICKQDLRATIGIYDPSLGQRSNEVSGRAILAREKQGDTGTFHFVDNLTRAIALTGRIVVDLIPHYYDTQRAVGYIDEEDQRKMITINEQIAHPQDVAQLIVDPTTDVTSGRFAVTVEAGPNYATKRQETADSMMQFIQAYPPAAPITGDLIAKSMDWPMADKIAERLKLMLPPQILQAEQAKDDGQPAVPPQVMAQMAQMSQQLQEAGQAVQQLQAENQQLKSGVVDKVQIAKLMSDQKREEAQAAAQFREDEAIAQFQTDERIAEAQNASKERIARANNATDVTIAALKAPAQTAQEVVEPEGPRIEDALLILAQTMQQMSAMHSAPRHSKLVFDDMGNPTGTVSAPMLQ